MKILQSIGKSVTRQFGALIGAVFLIADRRLIDFCFWYLNDLAPRMVAQ
jgi:hypothetical protein